MRLRDADLGTMCFKVKMNAPQSTQRCHKRHVIEIRVP